MSQPLEPDPALLARMSDHELEQLLSGYGYHPYFVEGHEPEAMHQLMAGTLDSASKRYQALERAGATMQRPLWASTGAKNPGYGDLKYVEPLIGPQTVSTMPLERLEAYERGGVPAARLTENQAEALETLKTLREVGIDLNEITDRLLAEGVDKFVEPFEALHRVIDEKRLAALAERR